MVEVETAIANPGAFDALATDYDSTFTHTGLGRLLRPRVWEVLAQHFRPGDQVLELACGTGEDAVWLARRGLHVTATDGSSQMVTRTQAKAEAAGVADRVVTVQMALPITDLPIPDLQSSNPPPLQPSTPPTFHPSIPFSGIFSNFGGLNTINDWHSLARSLAQLVKPGGKVVLVPMGPLCPWEIGWYLLHGQVRTALRRFGESASAQIGDSIIPIWYPSAGRLAAAFSPWFEPIETRSLGLWLPPSYLGHFVDRWPILFEWLNRFEQATAKLTAGWGDHYVAVFQKKSDTPYRDDAENENWLGNG